MKTRLFFLFAIAFQLLLNGCATYTYTDAPPALGGLYSKYAVIGYEGELKPADDVGIVTTDGIIKIHVVDGKQSSAWRVFKSSGFYSGGRYQLHLLPGTHEILCAFSFDKGDGTRAWSAVGRTVSVTLSKGQILHLSWSEAWKGVGESLLDALIGPSRGNGAQTDWQVVQSDGSAARETIAKDFNDLVVKE